MSIKAVGKVLELDNKVKGAKRLILIALADSMSDDDGYTYPKRETIARKAGLSTSKKGLDYVTTLLTQLENDGYLIRHINAWAGTMQQIPAGKRPNVYRFTTKIWNPQAPHRLGTVAPDGLGSHGPPQIGEQNRPTDPSSDPPPNPHGETTADDTNDWVRLGRRATALGCTPDQWSALVADVRSDPTVRSPIAVARTRVTARQWPKVHTMPSEHDCEKCDVGWIPGPGGGHLRCPDIHDKTMEDVTT